MRYMGVRRQDSPTPTRFIASLAFFVAVAGAAILIRIPNGNTAAGTPVAVGAVSDPCASASPVAGAASAAPASPAPSGSAPACHDHGVGPTAKDFVSINAVKPGAPPPAPGRNASTGTFISKCGRDENNHHNSDNFVTSPGVSNGAHHTHDYVGNLSTDSFSTDESLAAAGTTCQQGDLSTYFWPSIRRIDSVGTDGDAPGGGAEGNVGQILVPTSVTVEYRGNPQSPVVAMPRFLRMITGDATAGTSGPAKARAQWSCTGFTDRVTTSYPLCPDGRGVQRVLDFPNCWDGKNTDSPNHRTHVVFPLATGGCAAGTQAVPQLRITLTYDVPPGPTFAVDTFPEQHRNPITDHGVFGNVMPEALMKLAVRCINEGRNC